MDPSSFLPLCQSVPKSCPLCISKFSLKASSLHHPHICLPGNCMSLPESLLSARLSLLLSFVTQQDPLNSTNLAIHSFDKCFFSAYYVLGAVLSVRDTEVDVINRLTLPDGVYLLVGWLRKMTIKKQVIICQVVVSSIKKTRERLGG